MVPVILTKKKSAEPVFDAKKKRDFKREKNRESKEFGHKKIWRTLDAIPLLVNFKSHSMLHSFPLNCKYFTGLKMVRAKNSSKQQDTENMCVLNEANINRKKSCP